MRRFLTARPVFILLVAAFVFAFSTEAVAQGKGKGKKKSAKKTKSTEKVESRKAIDASDSLQAEELSGRKGKRRGDSDKTDKDRKGKDREDQQKAGKKNKYRPKGLKKAEMEEWADGVPPGWSKGNKEGWVDGMPPGKSGKGERRYPAGSGDWNDARKEEWDGELEKAKERVRTRSRERQDTNQETENSSVISIEEAARNGVPIETAEKTIDTAVDRGMTGEEIEKITRAMTYGSDKNVDQTRLGDFVQKKMTEGETGDDIAVSIYEEIDSGTLEKKPVEEKKKSWWRRMFKKD
ncbi:MAG: hypothetical protein KAV42_09215 [Candidatus Krumholzibacteria bacterium]|nr:hypothetical protein [Candidatus Krumholzibacteria bacterium]